MRRLKWIIATTTMALIVAGCESGGGTSNANSEGSISLSKAKANSRGGLMEDGAKTKSKTGETTKGGSRVSTIGENGKTEP